MNESDRALEPSSAEVHRLAELVERLRDDALDDAEVAELEARLAESAAAREAFAGFALLAAELHNAPGRFSHPVTVPGRMRVAVVFLRTRWQPLAWAVGLAVAAWFVWPRLAGFVVHLGATLATISNASGAVLRAAGERPAEVKVGAEVRTGALHLRSGLLKLTHPNGVVVTLESPARFELRSATTLWLAEGNARARVPPAAAGFTIETPSASIVDLGTEFSVSAGARSSEVHGFAGGVLVKNRGEPDSLRLIGHRATRIDRETRMPTGIDYRPDLFLRRFDEPTSRYPELIEQLEPVAYYRMRITSEATRLFDVSPHQRQGEIFAGAAQNTAMPGRLGAGLGLGGPAAGSFAVVANFPAAPAAALTVCAWVRADSRPRWVSIAKHWAEDRGANAGGQFHFGLQQDSGELEARVHEAAGREVGVRDTMPVPLGESQFVAFTLDGAMLRLYRNGREAAPRPARASGPTRPLRSASASNSTPAARNRSALHRESGTAPSTNSRCFTARSLLPRSPRSTT